MLKTFLIGGASYKIWPGNNIQQSNGNVVTSNGLLFVILSLHGWEVFPMPGALSHTRIIWASHQWRHKSRVSFLGPPCAHGVWGIPYGEVCNKATPGLQSNG